MLYESFNLKNALNFEKMLMFNLLVCFFANPSCICACSRCVELKIGHCYILFYFSLFYLKSSEAYLQSCTP